MHLFIHFMEVKTRQEFIWDSQIRDRDMFLHSCHVIDKLYCGMLN
jgi:hypothetical protein